MVMQYSMGVSNTIPILANRSATIRYDGCQVIARGRGLPKYLYLDEVEEIKGDRPPNAYG